MNGEIALLIWFALTALALVAVGYLGALLIPAIVMDRGSEERMRNDRHYISGGHVFCPVRREDTDIESCFSCRSLSEVNVHSSPPFIACDPPRPASAGEGDALNAAWRLQHHRGR